MVQEIHDDAGYWNQLETFIRDHSQAEFTHGICPECVKRLSAELRAGQEVGGAHEYSDLLRIEAGSQLAPKRSN